MDHETWADMQRIDKRLSDAIYDIRLKMREQDQAIVEELYDIRIRLMRLEEKLGAKANG